MQHNPISFTAPKLVYEVLPQGHKWLKTTEKWPHRWAQKILGVIASFPSSSPAGSSESKHLSGISTEHSSSQILRVPGNQAMNEDRARKVRMQHTPFSFPPAMLFLLLYLMRGSFLLLTHPLYFIWINPTGSEKASPTQPLQGNLPQCSILHCSLLPSNSTCMNLVALVLALTDRLFHCLPLFCAWSSRSTQRSWGAMARVKRQTSV